MAEGFRKASPSDTITIGKILEESVITLPEENGEKRCKYKTGFSDEKVARKASKVCGRPITATMILTVRTDVYGRIPHTDRMRASGYKQKGTLKLQEALDRIAALEGRLDSLIDRLGGDDKPKANGNGQYRFPLTAAE